MISDQVLTQFLTSLTSVDRRFGRLIVALNEPLTLWEQDECARGGDGHGSEMLASLTLFYVVHTALIISNHFVKESYSALVADTKEEVEKGLNDWLDESAES